MHSIRYLLTLLILIAGFAATPANTKPVPVPATKPAVEGTQTAIPLPKPDLQQSPVPAQPEARKSERIYQAACLPLLRKEVIGKILPPVNNGQCQIRSPLEITAFSKPASIQFDQPVTTNCTMAVALNEWIHQANILAKMHLGSDIQTIHTGSHYQCRNVNNGSTGRVSEHAFGNALDIMSFTLTNGESTELAKDWNGEEKYKQFWRDLHTKSCSLFMTVLGPEADEAHKTNLHLDMGCHGKSCTTRICQ